MALPDSYLFVDGGFLQRIIATMEEGVFGQVLPIDNAQLFGRHKRTFYYDAEPAKKPSQQTAEHDQQIAKARKLFDKLSLVPNLHVRTGTSRYRKSRGQEQKGVDILLAIEVYQHAVQGNMELATIMTSDLDFYPVFEALTGTRVRSRLLYDPRTTSRELVQAADIAEPINALTVVGWREPEFQKMMNASWAGWTENRQGWVVESKSGEYKGEKFEIWFDPRNKLYIGCSYADHKMLRSTSKAVVLSGFETQPGIKVVL